MSDATHKLIEEWRPIPGFPKYEVSTYGNVRSEKRGKAKVLAITEDEKGYHKIDLVGATGRKCCRVQRLVAAAFIGPCPVGHQVNHKNGVKADNRPCNLEYATDAENQKHAHETGLKALGEDHESAKLTELAVILMRQSSATDQALADLFGVCQNTVNAARRGLTWKHVKMPEYSGDALGPVEEWGTDPEGEGADFAKALAESKARVAVIEEAGKLLADMLSKSEHEKVTLKAMLQALVLVFKRQSSYSVGSGKYGSGHSAAMTFAEEKLSAVLNHKDTPDGG